MLASKAMAWAKSNNITFGAGAALCAAFFAWQEGSTYTQAMLTIQHFTLVKQILHARSSKLQVLPHLPACCRLLSNISVDPFHNV